MTEPVLREIVDGVGIITLNRPHARNAIDASMSHALSAAFDWLESENDIRVGILCANGPSFCAGMDLKAFASGDWEPIFAAGGGFGGLVRRETLKPLIAAIDGPALAGGFEIALACDMIVASPAARFGLPEVTLGLLAGAGGVFRLAERLPRAIATEILLTGRAISYNEAIALGLVSREAKIGEARAEALSLAAEIAATAPLACQATLTLMRAAERRQESQSWIDSDAMFTTIARSEDAHEGAQAFAEKRPPSWRGR